MKWVGVQLIAKLLFFKENPVSLNRKKGHSILSYSFCMLCNTTFFVPSVYLCVSFCIFSFPLILNTQWLLRINSCFFLRYLLESSQYRETGRLIVISFTFGLGKLQNEGTRVDPEVQIFLFYHLFISIEKKSFHKKVTSNIVNDVYITFVEVSHFPLLLICFYRDTSNGSQGYQIFGMY